MKVNFKELNIEVTFDNFQAVDIAKELGNYIHQVTNDIGLDDTARDIYHSDGWVDIPLEHAEAIVAIVSRPECAFLACIKKAIINALKE